MFLLNNWSKFQPILIKKNSIDSCHEDLALDCIWGWSGQGEFAKVKVTVIENREKHFHLK